jgi:hypothetical protein
MSNPYVIGTVCFLIGYVFRSLAQRAFDRVDKGE